MIFEAGQTQLKVSSKSRIQNIVGDTIPTNSQLENHSGSLLEVSICTFFLYVYGTFMTNKISKLVSDGLILSSIPQVWNGRSEHLGNDFLRLLDCFTTDFHSRSFTGQEESVSHRVVNEELICSIRKANTSWEQGKCSNYIWRLDEHTWILCSYCGKNQILVD
ncbi:hypothetical protein HanXRQr2_Chr10g0441581 [Helianthus annuus]|uniref:Uncharacterized protein n=1 Tax=Helianthus annuus TaxID=4232 RepID=A0A251TIX3_HELAN|nr:uncharacterized protein LOC110885092 [Helianthus annuus]KAF5786493.1 hypothetical protein HanXRQr2_Chr10g0441581 [Helianthus annuus]